MRCAVINEEWNSRSDFTLKVKGHEMLRDAARTTCSSRSSLVSSVLPAPLLHTCQEKPPI
jgi:hypothetical protein